jgi:hypothetical protein
MLRKHMKRGLTILRLGAMLVVGAGSWGMAAAASQAQAQVYAGQVQEIKIDHVTAEPAHAHPRGGYHRGYHHGGHSGRYYGGHYSRHHGGYYGGYRHYRPYDSGYLYPYGPHYGYYPNYYLRR